MGPLYQSHSFLNGWKEECLLTGKIADWEGIFCLPSPPDSLSIRLCALLCAKEDALCELQ